MLHGRKERHGTLWRSYAHEPQQDALGELAGRRTASPPHRQGEGDRRPGTRRRLLSGQVEDQAKASWRTHAGAIGGGSAVSFRCRRIFRITSPRVMAAMSRRAPR